MHTSTDAGAHPGPNRPTTAAEELMLSLERYRQIKFLVLCALLAYVVVITGLHYSTCKEDEHKRDKYAFIQTVLFGHTGVMVYVFTLLFFTVLLIIFMPFLRKLWSARPFSA